MLLYVALILFFVFVNIFQIVCDDFALSHLYSSCKYRSGNKSMMEICYFATLPFLN